MSFDVSPYLLPDSQLLSTAKAWGVGLGRVLVENVLVGVFMELGVTRLTKAGSLILVRDIPDHVIFREKMHWTGWTNMGFPPIGLDVNMPPLTTVPIRNSLLYNWACSNIYVIPILKVFCWKTLGITNILEHGTD